MLTVIPGLQPRHPNLVRHFYDERFPVAPYRNFIAADLCETARTLCGSERFDRLPAGDRARVVQSRLDADDIQRRLYTGAILLTQVACYAGIYDDDQGCPFIDFHGRSGVTGPAASSYPNAESFLPASMTAGGHPA